MNVITEMNTESYKKRFSISSKYIQKYRFFKVHLVMSHFFHEYIMHGIVSKNMSLENMGNVTAASASITNVVGLLPRGCVEVAIKKVKRWVRRW